MRLYGLFHRTITSTGRRIYTRVSGTGAYPKQQAIKIFQSSLINGSISGEIVELRPLPKYGH